MVLIIEQGEVNNGSIVLSKPLPLPEGTKVRIQVEPIEPIDTDDESSTTTPDADEDFANLPFFGMWADPGGYARQRSVGSKTERKMVRTNNTNRIIDSDILIDASKENKNAISFLATKQNAEIRISIISAIELVIGCRNKTELSQTQKFLQGCTILPITVNASKVAYQLIETFALSHGLLMGDALIAATALEHGSTLYTKNTRHFQMIPELAIMRPY